MASLGIHHRGTEGTEKTAENERLRVVVLAFHNFLFLSVPSVPLW
jgi:hypothetical protein